MKDKRGKNRGVFGRIHHKSGSDDEAGCNDPVVPKMHGFPVFIGWGGRLTDGLQCKRKQ